MKAILNRIGLLIDLIEFRNSAFAIYAIASFLSVSLRIKGFKPSSDYIFDSLLLGLSVTTLTYLLLWLGFKTIHVTMRHGLSWRFGVALLLPAVGATRGLGLYFVIDLYGYENRISLFNSTISSLCYTTIYYSGASIFISLLLRRNRQFSKEFQEAMRARLRREIDSTSDPEVQTFEDAMQRVRGALSSHLTNESEWSRDRFRNVAAEIQTQIETVIRPLSHRLWINSMGEIQIGNPWSILIDAIREMRFSKSFIIGYQFFMGIFGIGISIGLRNGIIKSLLATSTSMMLFAFFEWYRGRVRHMTISSSLMFLISLAVFPVIASEYVSYLLDLRVDWVGGAIIAPALPALLVLSAVYGLVNRDKAFAVSAARSVNFRESSEYPYNASVQANFGLSDYLHNTLQSELHRISRQLEDSSDCSRSEERIEELSKVLYRSREEIAQLQSEGLERLREVCRSWEGIAHVSLNYEEIDRAPKEKVAVVVSLLEEIISNSVRHANANDVAIFLEGSLDGLDVAVEHNGSSKVLTRQPTVRVLSIYSPRFETGRNSLKMKFTI